MRNYCLTQVNILRTVEAWLLWENKKRLILATIKLSLKCLCVPETWSIGAYLSTADQTSPKKLFNVFLFLWIFIYTQNLKRSIDPSILSEDIQINKFFI